MKHGSLAALLAVALLAIVAAAPVSAATTINGGNAVVNRGVLDLRSSFVVVDTNAPISGSGFLTSWTYWAGAQLPVQLKVVRLIGTDYVVVGEGPLMTPSTTGVAVTAALSPVIPVEVGDFVGLYFGSTGVVPFDWGGSAAVYTASVAVDPAIGSTLVVDGTSSRTYSVAVTGYGYTPGTHVKTELTGPYPVTTQVGDVIFNVSSGQPNNLETTVQLRKMTPNATYDVYLFVDTYASGSGMIVGSFTTNGVGNATFHFNAAVPSGIHSVAIDVARPVSGADVFVTPGLYGQDLYLAFS